MYFKVVIINFRGFSSGWNVDLDFARFLSYDRPIIRILIFKLAIYTPKVHSFDTGSTFIELTL